MNTVSTNFRFLVENDNNPLISFDSHGKIIYLNKSAELFISSAPQKELYELTLMHATKNFGSKLTHIDLVFKLYKFYAINVLYENEDEIAIHLYIKSNLKQQNIVLDGYTSTDINILLEANIELFRTQYNGNLRLFTDFDLPEIEMNQNNFSILLRKIFDQCREAKSIEIELKIKIGEVMIIGKKRYPILIFMIKTDSRSFDGDIEIEKLANKNYINSFLSKKSYVLEIPYIKNKRRD